MRAFFGWLEIGVAQAQLLHSESFVGQFGMPQDEALVLMVTLHLASLSIFVGYGVIALLVVRYLVPAGVQYANAVLPGDAASSWQKKIAY